MGKAQKDIILMLVNAISAAGQKDWHGWREAGGLFLCYDSMGI